MRLNLCRMRNGRPVASPAPFRSEPKRRRDDEPEPGEHLEAALGILVETLEPEILVGRSAPPLGNRNALKRVHTSAQIPRVTAWPRSPRLREKRSRRWTRCSDIVLLETALHKDRAFVAKRSRN